MDGNPKGPWAQSLFIHPFICRAEDYVGFKLEIGVGGGSQHG